MTIHQKTKVKDWQTEIKPQWCPGCTYFADLQAIYKVIIDLNFDPTNFVLIGGIGCTGRITSYVNTYTIHTLHGRPLPVALGFKLANPKMNVIVVSGDGDLFAIGGTHFIHTARKNIDITVIMFDNFVYGLTKGQASPTSPLNLQTPTTPTGVKETPINPLVIAISSGATFVAQAFALDVNDTFNIIKQAINHKGFSFVNILSPCITYYRMEDLKSFKSKIKKLENHDFNDINLALSRAFSDHFSVGIFYKKEDKTYEEQILNGNVPIDVDIKVLPKEKIQKMIDSYS